MAKCAECTYLDISDGNSNGAFWCEKKLERHLATDIECGSFCRAYSRYSSSINNAIEYSNSHNSSGGCYLTTMLCNILKMKDDNIYLETMRNFRNNILQKDEKYKPILVEYDIVGPKIAKALYDDPLNTKVAAIYFAKYIFNIKILIEDNQYNEAINMYTEMTTSLKSFYGIDNYNITVEEIKNTDLEKSGHGIYAKKKITSNWCDFFNNLL